MTPANTIESVKGLHQYYRDCLSQPVEFPDIGTTPPELIEWVVDYRNTDVVQLAEYLHDLPDLGLPPQQDRALRLMLFTIIQANLATDFNNRYPGYTLPPEVAATIKRGLGRVLELHPANGYLVLCVQLLHRIKEVEEVLLMAETYPGLFDQFPVLQAIAGFTYTMLGDYEKGLGYLQPLAGDPAQRNLPLVGLAAMTCQHFLGQVPEWPMAFGSLRQDTSDLPRLLELLPPLEMIQPLDSKGTRPVVFVACDATYFFEHAQYLAYSIHATNAGRLDLHLHLYGPPPRVLAAIERLREALPGMAIGVSAEHGTAPIPHPPTYYATARFVRAWQVLGAYGRELCMLDADALVNASWDTFTAKLRPGTELVLACPEVAPFWEHVIAGFIYCKPTALAEQFMAKVAHFILDNMERRQAIWFTDQIALSATDSLLTSTNPAVQHIDADQLIDTKFGPDALCWAVTTKKTGNPPYDAVRERLLKRYS